MVSCFHCVAFAMPRGPGAVALLFSPREVFVLPGACAASRRLLAPARGAPRLLRSRPSSASRGGASRCPHKVASPTPHPGATRWGPRGLRSDGRSHPPGGLASPSRSSRNRSTGRVSVFGRGVGTAPGARPQSRRSVRVPSGQTGGWRRWPRPGSHPGEGNSEGPDAGLCLLGRAQGVFACAARGRGAREGRQAPGARGRLVPLRNLR